MKRLILLAACVSASASVFAQQIVFRHEAQLSGTLAGVPFGPTTVVVRAVGDMSNRQSFSNGFVIDNNSTSADIHGVGVVDFVSPTRTFVNHALQAVGIGRSSQSFLDIMNGPIDSNFATWDMLSAIGPITGNGAAFNWDQGDFMTSGGVLDVTSGNVTITFGASPCDSSGTPFCFGDGTGAACPCAANGAPGEGCRNSSGSGARLVGGGDPCHAIDSLYLEVTGVPDGKPGILLRGDAQVANPMADGIRCAGGTILRSQVQMTTGGATLFSDFAGQPFGAVSSTGVLVNFQFIYRDPANNCSGQGFNYSNGWAVTYQP